MHRGAGRRRCQHPLHCRLLRLRRRLPLVPLRILHRRLLLLRWGRRCHEGAEKFWWSGSRVLI